jgi:hypothetical protein
MSFLDWVSPILTGLAGASVAALVHKWATGGNGRAVPGSELRYSARARALSWLYLGVAGFIAFVAIEASAGQRGIAFVLGGGFLTWAIWSWVDTHFFRAEYDQDGLHIRSP